MKKLCKTCLQADRSITKKHFELFAIPFERNDRNKSRA